MWAVRRPHLGAPSRSTYRQRRRPPDCSASLKGEISLQVLVERDPALLNYIAVIRVNPALFLDVSKSWIQF